MIRVEMKLDSFGLGVKVRELCSLVIYNDGTGTASRGNYEVLVYSKDRKRVIRTGRVENWPRNAKHPVDLLAAALDTVRK